MEKSPTLSYQLMHQTLICLWYFYWFAKNEQFCKSITRISPQSKAKVLFLFRSPGMATLPVLKQQQERPVLTSQLRSKSTKSTKWKVSCPTKRKKRSVRNQRSLADVINPSTPSLPLCHLHLQPQHLHLPLRHQPQSNTILRLPRCQSWRLLLHFQRSPRCLPICLAWWWCHSNYRRRRWWVRIHSIDH